MHPIFKITSRVSPLFRKRRIQKFLRLFNPSPEIRILDVGGLPRFWHEVPCKAQITLLNLHPLDDYDRSFLGPNHTSVVGDGTKLPYAFQEFDIVFSNSVIEHVGTIAQQTRFAKEIRRVGKGYWVQTPAKEFFFEPHYFTPFIHWLPTHIQKRLLRNFSLWGWLERPTDDWLDIVLAELRLINRAEFNEMFPDGNMWIERFVGMPKSYTAYKLPETKIQVLETSETNRAVHQGTQFETDERVQRE